MILDTYVLGSPPSPQPSPLKRGSKTYLSIIDDARIIHQVLEALLMSLAHSSLRTDFKLLIDGQLVDSDHRLDVINPATGQIFANCPAASKGDLDRAVAAARRAAVEWSAKSFAERADYIKRFSDALRAEQEPLAELLTREQGKPIGQARDEIGRAFAQAEGMTTIKIETETLVNTDQQHIQLQYHALGVVGIITPWNAPINLAAGPMVSALYTGNTVIIKPSPFTPLSTLKIGEIARELFPAGVINILAGGDELGQWMSEHPGIDKISFTGSVATGKRVMASAAGNLKRITLELGGNDAAIVLDDVDVATVAPKLFFASFVNCGQVCMAIKRIYAHEKIYEALCTALADLANKFVVGDGLDPTTQLGPIQNKKQYERVLEILDDTHQQATQHGARILAGGQRLDRPGYFIAPTVVAGIADDSRLVREEQFGPIVPVLQFTHVEDALRRANDTRYGLSGSVWSADITKASQIAAQLQVGTAWVNQHRATSAFVPFGGAKESGFGRQYSIVGLKAYMEPRVVSILKK